MSDYYKFGKVQVLDISRHLTSNAGQAVQYIARSCRLDGNNKGKVESDLRKAIDFLRDELDRVETANRSEAGLLNILHNASVGDLQTVDGNEYWRKIGPDTWDVAAGCSSLFQLRSQDLAKRLSND